MKARLYLETTIVSYLVARPSSNEVIRVRQRATQAWWEARLADFEPFVSDVVLSEAADGDARVARQRLDKLKDFPVLQTSPASQDLARDLVGPGLLPDKAVRDAAHLAIAARNQMHFLLTLNFRHINNREILERVEAVCLKHGCKCPIVCTPEELMGLKAS
jgi:hypothetical protein